MSMEIIKSPKIYSPAYQEALFELTAHTDEVVELDILTAPHKIAGKKRLRGQDHYFVNVAGYAKQQIDVRPIESPVCAFFTPTHRVAYIEVCSQEQRSATILTSSTEPFMLHKALSDMPKKVKIAPTEQVEISFYTDETPLLAEAYFKGGSQEVRLTLAQKNADQGIVSLYVVMSDIAKNLHRRDLGMISDYHTMEVSISIEESEVVINKQFGLMREQSDGVRLCWWNRWGQIDYYTFRHTLVHHFGVTKEKIYCAKGYRTIYNESQQRQQLSSGYIDRKSMLWLQEIIAAPRVWKCQEGRHLPVEIITDHLTYASDKLICLELEITPSVKRLFQSV